MNKRLMAILGFFALAFPVTANAQVRPYVEATASTNRIDRATDFRNDISYGGRVGVEAPLSGAFSLTADVGAENFISGTDNLTLNANAGLSARVAGPFSLYTQAGVLRNSGEYGYRLGGGAKLDLSRDSYVRVGYQRDKYESRVDADSVAVALGLRF